MKIASSVPIYHKSGNKPVGTCSVGSNFDDKEVIFRGKYQIYSIYNEEGFNLVFCHLFVDGQSEEWQKVLKYWELRLVISKSHSYKKKIQDGLR